MTRLYYPEMLSEQGRITLQDDHVHYLRNVLRQQVGAQVNLFNGQDGEWLGKISCLTKSHGDVILQERLREAETEPQAILLFCPIKQDPTHYLIEKCTEIGVKIFQPVIMERGNIPKVNRDKLQRIAIEASQQCERLSVSEVRELRNLRDVLNDWPGNTILYVCAERGLGGKQRQEFSAETGTTMASLIGPEGGIHPKEIELLSQYPFVKFISLGKNILRAETAAVVAATKMILG